MSDSALRGDWQEWRARWARFADWETKRLSWDVSSFPAALDWLDGARDLAVRMNPEWGSGAEAEQHWRELARIHDLLARIDLSR